MNILIVDLNLYSIYTSDRRCLCVRCPSQGTDTDICDYI